MIRTGVRARSIYDERMEESATPREWIDEFEAASRRPLELRLRYAFIKTYKPVMDDTSFRAFETMMDYRAWCEAHVPSWLGYGRV